MEEAEAITRLKQGDIGGLEVLVHLYERQALRASYLVCQDYPLAEDVVQSAFLRAYQRIDQFDPTRSFGPWFLRSVVNDTLMVLRRRRHISLADVLLAADDWQPDAGPSLDDLLAGIETKEAIWAALDQLSPRQRAAIVLRYYLDLNDLQVAELLGCPPGTLRRRLHDARLRLRHLLPSWVHQ